MKYNVTYVYDHAVITITVNAPNQDLAEISADEMLGDWGDLNDVTVEELESEKPKDSYPFVVNYQAKNVVISDLDCEEQ